MPIMAKRSPISAAAGLLLFFNKEKVTVVFQQVAPLCTKQLMKVKLTDMFRITVCQKLCKSNAVALVS